MEKIKWSRRLDQYLENNVWTQVPEKYNTPHFFFLLGVMFTIGLFVFLGIITKILL